MRTGSVPPGVVMAILPGRLTPTPAGPAIPVPILMIPGTGIQVEGQTLPEPLIITRIPVPLHVPIQPPILRGNGKVTMTGVGKEILPIQAPPLKIPMGMEAPEAITIPERGVIIQGVQTVGEVTLLLHATVPPIAEVVIPGDPIAVAAVVLQEAGAADLPVVVAAGAVAHRAADHAGIRISKNQFQV